MFQICSFCAVHCIPVPVLVRQGPPENQLLAEEASLLKDILFIYSSIYTSQRLSCQIESVHLHGRHETKFLTNSCMFAYELHCTTMCTCVILIVNLPPE